MLLRAAVRARPSHGYAIIEELRHRSDAVFDLPESTVYPALHRLEGDGLLESTWATVGGCQRRVYAITRRGRTRLGEHRAEWRRLVGGVSGALGEARPFWPTPSPPAWPAGCQRPGAGLRASPTRPAGRSRPAGRRRRHPAALLVALAEAAQRPQGKYRLDGTQGRGLHVDDHPASGPDLGPPAPGVGRGVVGGRSGGAAAAFKVGGSITGRSLAGWGCDMVRPFQFPTSWGPGRHRMSQNERSHRENSHMMA
ncbi:MAG: PadR family transcriptional regulator [Acidimicrobiales bacterium]